MCSDSASRSHRSICTITCCAATPAATSGSRPVIRPGIYDLQAGEQLGDLLAASGGFRPDAALQRVTVHRILGAAERGPGRAPRAALDVALGVAAHAPAGDGQGTSYGAAALGAPGVRVPALALMDGDSVVIDSL